MTLEQPSGNPEPREWREEGGTSAATTASHRVDDVTGAPIAGPLTAAMMGLSRSKASNKAWFCSTMRPWRTRDAAREAYHQVHARAVVPPLPEDDRLRPDPGQPRGVPHQRLQHGAVQPLSRRAWFMVRVVTPSSLDTRTRGWTWQPPDRIPNACAPSSAGQDHRKHGLEHRGLGRRLWRGRRRCLRALGDLDHRHRAVQFSPQPHREGTQISEPRPLAGLHRRPTACAIEHAHVHQQRGVTVVVQPRMASIELEGHALGCPTKENSSTAVCGMGAGGEGEQDIESMASPGRMSSMGASQAGKPPGSAFSERHPTGMTESRHHGRGRSGAFRSTGGRERARMLTSQPSRTKHRRGHETEASR